MEGMSSLLSFLGAPVVVGDPEGRCVYVNSAFERSFKTSLDAARGEALAQLFSGGGREAILGAVAEVCTRGETVSFRLKEGDAAYLGLCSPIEAELDRVGVVILLTDEPDLDQRLLVFQGEIAEPLDDIADAMEELLEQTGGRRRERYRVLVERGMSALERARKWNEELHGALCGRTTSSSSSASLDPVKVVRQVVGRVSAELEESEVGVQLLAPAQLVAARGDASMLESALMRLVRHRAAEAQLDGRITLSARLVGEGEGRGVLFSVIDRPAATESAASEAEDGEGSEPEPRVVRATVAALGGRICTLEEPSVGRVTAIRLGLAPTS
ncbi:MAG: PAS domain-containing protein [Deltaproteobacteria bacterium]|nr:PAS domain-containing protein [Deltaproteobacteria bacterium]